MFRGYVFLSLALSTFFKYGTMSAERNPSPDPTVGTPTLHIPTLMPFDSQLWLSLTETDFKTYGITGNISRFRRVGSYLTNVTA